MAEEDDVDVDVAAALVKLAGEDPVAARNAQAALEWITAGQGAEAITQEVIQNFLWYDLAMKWLVDEDEKLEVADALARALDLLGLPRYAAICRSATTDEILHAYEVSTEDGKAAFRRANIASGIEPPDLPEFVWGSLMGFQEASARSSVSGVLELAVASGDLVPGATGWKSRQQELTRTHLNLPRVNLMGQSLAQVILTERAETWIGIRRSDTRRRILAAVANRILPSGELPSADAADPMPQLRWLLEQLEPGIGLTQTGKLNQKFVQGAAGRFGWDSSRPPRTEDDLYGLHQLRVLAQRAGLARRSGKQLALTAKGRRLLAEPAELWRAVADRLIDGDDFVVFAGELFLALIIDVDAMPLTEIKTTVAQAAAEEGFRAGDTGEPPRDHEVGWAIGDTANRCRVLGLLSVGGDWSDRRYGLNEIGRATAHEALRARATGPRRMPRF